MRNNRTRDNKGRFMKGKNNWTKEKQRNAQRKCYYRHKEERKRKVKEYMRKLKLFILQYYSKNEIPFCKCCNEKEIKFLCLDHINGGGKKHRQEVGEGTNFYRWLKNNNYPKGLQVLCYNCNMAKGFWGKCPHQREKNER